MTDYLASADEALLQRHGLNDFEALWALQLDAVDEPNTGRGGWSSVFRLELEGKGFYLKRQSNYLTRTLHRPFGEPTFAREFRNISRYQKLRIPALQAVFYGERKGNGQHRAILMTRALDDWRDLDSLLAQWPQLAAGQREGILKACGQLARTLHAAGQVHGCFYPKHIFLRERREGWQAQLIDLEKTRPLLMGMRDRLKDLEPLLRRAPAWGEADVRSLLAAYLEQPGDSSLVDTWLQRLVRRRREKEAR
ncbi:MULTISPECIES: lipopolysaccharide kinase InaA family protein [Pseudomonas]|uniref:Lipopolysaccharide kinase n=1 Tax=Pseudomonas guariconensis TaxID=1288410 RepID=A0AAX0W1R5_9PSED|nr:MULTISPECIES: lipopolysaccharide kinase InaA family protein [Pseudomonas]MCO7620704.1 lipopolysaccharide kinase InaA family protein [Pseudomonas guariconensis]PLV21062.1 lipopolysaccharide kinase [Pseudomonas guariconensis]PLV25940.1 lipopolysaccharide kinase [Pseudomonas guariconensis]PLV31017.1 lipopolysaccharide kinase [Pseudomonas guariconensis]BBR56244.1 LPS kinase [Pseudomonas putida]